MAQLVERKSIILRSSDRDRLRAHFFVILFLFYIVKKISKPESILNEILKEITKVRIFYIIY